MSVIRAKFQGKEFQFPEGTSKDEIYNYLNSQSQPQSGGFSYDNPTHKQYDSESQVTSQPRPSPQTQQAPRSPAGDFSYDNPVHRQYGAESRVTNPPQKTGFFTGTDDASLINTVDASMNRRFQNTVASLSTDPQASRYQKRRAQKANQNFNEEMSKLSTVGQFAAGAADIAPVFAATAITRNPLTGAGMMGGFTTADTLAQQVDSTGEYDLSAAGAAGASSAGFDLITGGVAGRAVGNIAQSLSRPSTKVAKELGTMGAQGGVSNMGSQVFMNLGSDRPWYENVPEAGVSGFVAGGAIHGGTMGYNKLSGTNKALNYDVNESGTNSINRTAALNEEGFNLPNDVVDNVAEFNNINKARTDEIMNSSFSEDTTSALSSLSDVSVNHGTGTAVTNALGVLQDNNFPLTAKGMDLSFGTGYGKDSNYNLAELLGYDRKSIETSGENLTRLVPNRGSRKTGMSPERQRLQMKESYESGFNQITSPIRDGLSHLNRIKKESQLSDSGQNTKLIDIAINSLEDLNKKIPSMLDGKSMPTKDELATLDFNVRRSLSEIGELGNLKGLDGVKGNFNPANTLETLAMFHKMVTNQYPQVTYGTPDPGKESTKFWSATPESLGVDAALYATTGLPVVTMGRTLAKKVSGVGAERVYRKGLRDAGESAGKWASQVARRAQEVEANRVVNRGVEDGDTVRGSQEAQSDLESMGIRTTTDVQPTPENTAETSTAAPDTVVTPQPDVAPGVRATYDQSDLNTRARMGNRSDNTGLDNVDPSIVENSRNNLNDNDKNQMDSIGWKHREFLNGSSDSRPTQAEYNKLNELLNKGLAENNRDLAATIPSDFAGNAAARPKKAQPKQEETVVETPTESKETPPDLASRPKKSETKKEEIKQEEVKELTPEPVSKSSTKETTTPPDLASKPKKSEPKKEDVVEDKVEVKEPNRENDSSRLSQKPKQETKDKPEDSSTPKEDPESKKEDVVEDKVEVKAEEPKINAKSLVQKPIQDKINKVNKPMSQMTTALSNEFRRLNKFKTDVDNAVSGISAESKNDFSKNDVYNAIHEMGGVEKMMSDSPGSTVPAALNKLLRNYNKKVTDIAKEKAERVSEFTEKEMEQMKSIEESEVISNASNRLKSQGVDETTISEAISRAKSEIGDNLNPNLIVGFAKTIAKEKADLAKSELKAAESTNSKVISESSNSVKKSLADSRRDLYNYAERLDLNKDSRIRGLIDNATRWHGDVGKAKGLSEASERSILNKMHEHIQRELDSYESALKSPDTDQVVDIAKWRESVSKNKKKLEVFEQISKQVDKKSADRSSKAKVSSERISNSEKEIEALKSRIKSLEKSLKSIENIKDVEFTSPVIDKSINKILDKIDSELSSSNNPQEVLGVSGKMSEDMSGYFESVDSPKFILYQKGMDLISDKLLAVGKSREAKAVRTTSEIIRSAVEAKAQFPDNKDLWISVEDRNKINKDLSDDTTVSAWYGNLYQKLRSSVFGTENSKQFIINSRDKIEAEKKKIKARRVTEEQSRKDPGEDGVFAPGIK